MTVKAGVRYAAVRLGIIAAVAAVLYLVGLRGVLWLLLTVPIATLIASFTFRDERRAAADDLEAAMRQRRELRDAEEPADEARRPWEM